MAVTVKFRAPDTAPPGLLTVTGIAPGAVRKLSGAAAINCEELANVVGKGVRSH
jgi:hypothetical protein